MNRILGVVLIIFGALSFAFDHAGRTTQFETARQSKPVRRIHSLRILVLSTMLADRGIGEWGFAALVEADGHTGARPDTVIKNARELGVDVAGVQEVILTHNHQDHTGGLLYLRRELAKDNPSALSRVHVGRGIFWGRPRQSGEGNNMIAAKPAFEATGGVFIDHNEPVELYPGIWLTGPVPRVYPERNWSGTGTVKTPEGIKEDNIPEDTSLVFDTDKGLIVLSGCGHAGIINTLEYARSRIRPAPIYAAIGGFHLHALDDGKLDWTSAKLREFGLKQFLGGHCTGIEAVYRLRQQVGLTRETCVVSAVGSSFSLDKGIDPLALAR